MPCIKVWRPIRGETVLQRFLNILPALRGVHVVKLAGVDGFTGRGSIRYAANDNSFIFTVTLSGIAGRSADVYIDHEPACCIELTNGRAYATFSSSKGDKLPELDDGSHIEIRQNGDSVLSGVLTRA